MEDEYDLRSSDLSIQQRMTLVQLAKEVAIGLTGTGYISYRDIHYKLRENPQRLHEGSMKMKRQLAIWHHTPR